jgi:hypothetical protein
VWQPVGALLTTRPGGGRDPLGFARVCTQSMPIGAQGEIWLMQ